MLKTTRLFRLAPGIVALALFAAIGAHAQTTPRATLVCTPSTSAVDGYNAYRNAVRINAAQLPTCAYTDTTVVAGQSYSYTMRAVDANGVESLDSNAVTASIPGTPPQTVTISISPTSATVAALATRQFTATVQNGTTTAVIWSLGSQNCGTVSTTGLYTAPGTAASCTVIATSQADTSKAASAQVTVTATTPPPAAFKVGDRIQVLANANIRPAATNNGFATPVLGIAPGASLGTITAVSTAIIPGTNGAAFWIQVDFDTASLPTGYMGSDNMRLTTTPPPPPPTPTLTQACSKSGSTVVCTSTYANMPTGTAFTATAAAAGITRTNTVTIP